MTSLDFELQTDKYVPKFAQQIRAFPELSKSIGGIHVINITKDDKKMKQWVIDLDNQKMLDKVPEGVKLLTQMTMDDSVLVDLALNKISPQFALMRDLVTVEGSLVQAKRLIAILNYAAKL